MSSPDTPIVLTPRTMTSWKKIALISFFGGAGFAVSLALVVGTIVWYSSRPKPPKPWNPNAIVADGPPLFEPGADGKKIRFLYSLKNMTNTDYQIDSDASFKVLMKTKEGTFTAPITTENASVGLPVFIPAKQKAYFGLSLIMSVPQRMTNESDDEYHERLRAFLETNLNTDSFAVFDETNRYQINLPGWKSVPVSKKEDKSDKAEEVKADTKTWENAEVSVTCSGKERLLPWSSMDGKRVTPNCMIKNLTDKAVPLAPPDKVDALFRLPDDRVVRGHAYLGSNQHEIQARGEIRSAGMFSGQQRLPSKAVRLRLCAG